MGIPSDWGGTSTTRRCLLVFTSISFCHLARAQLFAARDLSSLEPQGSSVSECSLSCCRIYHPSETQHLFFTRGWFGHCANLQMEEGFFIRHQNIPFLGAYYYCASASGLRSFFFTFSGTMLLLGVCASISHRSKVDSTAASPFAGQSFKRSLGPSG